MVLLHGFIAVQYFPGSKLLNSDFLIWRMGFGILSYLSAAGLVFFAQKLFQNRLSLWSSVPFLGSIILALYGFAYFFINDYIGDINCRKQTIKFSECYLPNTSQTISAALLAFIFSFAIAGTLYLTLIYLFTALTKRNGSEPKEML